MNHPEFYNNKNSGFFMPRRWFTGSFSLRSKIAPKRNLLGRCCFLFKNIRFLNKKQRRP